MTDIATELAALAVKRLQPYVSINSSAMKQHATDIIADVYKEHIPCKVNADLLAACEEELAVISSIIARTPGGLMVNDPQLARQRQLRAAIMQARVCEARKQNATDDLLPALENLLVACRKNRLMHGGRFSSESDPLAAEVEEARAAIAKARGE